MWGTTAAGTFIINFYDSSKLSSTSGTGLTNSNYSSFVDVPSGATATDVVTSVSVTGTVQYGKNGGLTAGTGTAASADTHYVTFNIGNDYKVTKCTVYATAYESGRWLLNGNAASSGSLGSKGATIDNVTSPLVWNNLGGLSSLTFKKDNGSGGNQKRLTIYKIVCEYQVTVVATDLDVKTAPTKVNYKVGETLDLTGLVLDATVGGNHVDVTSGYTAKIGETTVTSGTTTLNDVGAQTVTFTYGGQNTTQTIHVGDLESIALTTTSVKTTYDEGQTFDPTNLVVTATYSDGEDTPTTWTEDVTASCSYDPDGALETTDDNVEVSYTWGSTTKTANITITVNEATAYTVTFNAGTGTCGTSSLTEAAGLAGVELPTATIGVTGWSFAGWATAATGNTEVAPTLYTAGSTYHPTDNCTLYAVYSFSEVSTTTYKRATSVSDITSADKIVIAYNDGKVLNTSINMSTTLVETSGKVTPASNAIFTLEGNNTDGYTLTNGTSTIGATGNGTSLTIALSSTNNLWAFSASTYGSNHFNVNNKVTSGKSLEVFNSAWKAYALTASEQAWAMRIYVPAEITVYNSNPAAIVNPDVAFTTAGDKALYVKNENSYTNAANVTGIAKTPVYTSSDVTVATVSDAGVVTALKAGMTTITATVAAEVGVNTEASAFYEVTVKDASNIAGLKAITSSATVVSFTADLTNAVVTYVNGDYAYIQDASGAVYASCGSSLTAGKKINGAVSGSIKAANQIDEITEIDLNDAEISDGVIPSAAVITAATLAANKADYEGKLVQIVGATVTASLTSGNASGGKISDDGKTTEINLYAPAANIEALKDAEGTFNGYISLYGGSSVRFNIYNQSQIVLTKNAPTAQTLSFESDAVELDEVTPAFDDFTGQAVSGAIGDVTYSIEDGGDESGVVSSINASTGAVVLSGACGTATITATAAAKEVTVAGVTTPYTTTTKTYTVTVNPRYMVTFSVNGVETVLRQANSGASIAVPTPSDFGDYKFMGWNTEAVDPTDTKPAGLTDLEATIYPIANAAYYAVFAKQTVGDDELVTFYSNAGTTGTDATSGVSMDATTNGNNGNSAPGFNLNKTLTMSSINLSGYKSPTSLYFDYIPGKSGETYTTFVVKQYNSSSTLLSTTNVAGKDHTKYMKTDAISLDLSCVQIVITSSGYTSNCYIDNIEIKATRPSISYEDYRTSLPTVEVTITDAQYATFCYARELNVAGTGVTAYTASANGEGEAVTLTKISDNIIPANTGVILFAASAGNYEITVSETGKEAIAGNELVGVTTRTQIPETSADKYNYIFSKKDDVIGFYRASGAYLLPNRAYLSTSTKNAAAREFMAIMFDEGENTSLREVRGLKAEVRGEFFNLNGQRVATPVKGNIYIVNGKKVMFK